MNARKTFPDLIGLKNAAKKHLRITGRRYLKFQRI